MNNVIDTITSDLEYNVTSEELKECLANWDKFQAKLGAEMEKVLSWLEENEAEDAESEETEDGL